MDEFDAACEWMAKRGLKGVDGDLLPPLLSADCQFEIDAFPDDFQKRVSEFAYMLARESPQTPSHALP